MQYNGQRIIVKFKDGDTLVVYGSAYTVSATGDRLRIYLHAEIWASWPTSQVVEVEEGRFVGCITIT